jgi:energy-coupling factor transport system substrate-specific component
MFATKIAMQGIPNVHLLALFTAAFTLAYRVKALVPIYVYVLLDGVFAGFSFWWLPYVYIWIPLWGAFMFRPKNTFLCMLLCGLHGLLFGIMYSPVQALFFGLNFDAAVTWIIAGLPFDVIHGVSNFCLGALVLPLYKLLIKLNKSI